MLDITLFDDVFGLVGKNHYPTHLVGPVHAAQEELDAPLYFHRLLDVLNLKTSSKLYPPKNAKEFRTLHQHIAEASCQTIQKQALLYYLIKDCCVVAKDNSAADAFQKAACLPKKYWFAMQGLWCLDKLNFKEAVEYLTQPSLLPVFGSEILATLLRAGEDSLALAYFDATNPALNTPELREQYFAALVRASLTQGFFFMRRQSPSANVRKPLLKALFDSVLSLPGGEQRRDRAAELVDLPFDEEEEQWVREYLTKHNGRSDLSHDILVMRFIAKGEYNGALEQINRKKTSRSNHDGIKWENVAQAVNRGIGERKGLDGWTVD
ncbi:hypothetical protein BT63DRAFT_459707 [Microthyrium microscopicum]|uniref:ELYS-like domain-containing protein n=1 Tax=Microthyrium microscopicum TaxID=703497 RepID=A0A6A6U1T3_9PEZI|nr:hypothetical protein BT63DRAFT_459707 [Microthyrium microscopicum]